jgi:hypothetical protein
LDSCNGMMGCTTGHRWDRKSECVNRSMGTTLPPSQRLGGGRSSGASGAQCRNRYVFTFSQNAGWVGPQTEYMTHKHITDGHSLLFSVLPAPSNHYPSTCNISTTHTAAAAFFAIHERLSFALVVLCFGKGRNHHYRACGI